MSIRALVVDDEPLARSRMKRLLGAHPDVTVVGEAASGAEAVTSALALRPDVVFLDVNMPGQTGIEALRTLQGSLPEQLWPLAVFTTAYEEHAVEAFDLEGTDYLLKPVEVERLARALRRVRKELWARNPAPATTPAPSTAAAAPHEPAPPAAPEPASEAPVDDVGHLAAHRAGRIVRLAIDDIACVQVEDTITFAYTAGGRFRLRMSLHEVESRLPSPPFVRVSRSAIVQLGQVKHLEPMFSGTYVAVMADPLELKVDVSRRRARHLRELLGW
jgi:two-component system, LytTR family, response regulator